MLLKLSWLTSPIVNVHLSQVKFHGSMRVWWLAMNNVAPSSETTYWINLRIIIWRIPCGALIWRQALILLHISKRDEMCLIMRGRALKRILWRWESVPSLEQMCPSYSIIMILEVVSEQSMELCSILRIIRMRYLDMKRNIRVITLVLWVSKRSLGNQQVQCSRIQQRVHAMRKWSLFYILEERISLVCEN